METADRRPSWSDAPRRKSDIIGRQEFAKTVASQVGLCVPGQESTVFGLVGPWGSGKTTLLREIEQLLDHWRVVWFSPWSVSSVGSITEEFVSTLAEAYPSNLDLKSRLARYARFGSPALKALPMVGSALGEFVDAQTNEILRRKPWQVEFDEICSHISSIGERVLIVVDDVDRLDPEELRSLLRVVRLLGRFTDVHYLLAYDQETIERGLQGASGRGYMEKIVQYPFEVPPPARIVRQRWAESVVSLLEDGETGLPARYFDDRTRLLSLLSKGLETPRASGRLREQVAGLANLVKEAEVDSLDFIALTWLRIHHHKVWDNIRRSQEQFIAWETPEGRSSPTSLEVALNLVEPEHAAVVDSIVRFLFEPENKWSNFEPGGRRALIRFERYFERYFQIGLSEDDVSEALLSHAVAQLLRSGDAGHEVEEVRRLLTATEHERSVLAFVILRELRAEASDTSVELINFTDEVRREIKRRVEPAHGLVVDADQWYLWEVSRAVACALEPADLLAARFGFMDIMASLHAIGRARAGGRDEISALYDKFVVLWLQHLAGLTLSEILAIPEFLTVVAYCTQVSRSKDSRGFLSSRISDGGDLLDAATAFVIYVEWTGSASPLTYEVKFNRDEFEYAIGMGAIRQYAHQIVPPLNVGSYETIDLPSRSLTKDQFRDLAYRSVVGEYGP